MTLPDQGITNYIATFDQLTFTVDTGATDVPIVWGGAAEFHSADATPDPFFEAGDNIFIENVEIIFPYQFGQGVLSTKLSLSVEWYSDGGLNGPITNLGDNGRLNVPDPNCLFPVNTPVYYPSPDETKWGLRVNDMDGNVSMINAPAVLNSEVLLVIAILKVRSTYEMIA